MVAGLNARRNQFSPEVRSSVAGDGAVARIVPVILPLSESALAQSNTLGNYREVDQPEFS